MSLVFVLTATTTSVVAIRMISASSVPSPKWPIRMMLL
ncbi:hypothetical protein PI126_g17942 [Phytophthora idaei]|nr:hypothetical protein PI126_g17942 [Phytophthora idaei]